MCTENIYQHISIDNTSIIPKYTQLTNSILKGIEQGKIGNDYFLPSINELSYELEVSRNTAEKAYRHLRNIGVLRSVPGKGYVIAKNSGSRKYKIFLLFNKLSEQKKMIYDAIVSILGNAASIDLHIYNNDFGLFRKLISEHNTSFSHYIIIPHFTRPSSHIAALINQLTEGKLILLNKKINGITRSFGSVTENFELDIYNALLSAGTEIRKYTEINIIYSSRSYFPKDILRGLSRFCTHFNYGFRIVEDLTQENLKKGGLYINLSDEDMATFIDKISGTDFKLGKDIGMISYNESPLKKYIFQGISTISTDFYQIGRTAAKMILEDHFYEEEIPVAMRIRPSV